MRWVAVGATRQDAAEFNGDVGREIGIRLRFNADVRRTVAAELRRVSTFGGIALGVLGYTTNEPITLFGAFVWWVACQTLSALLLALEDDE